MGIPVRWRARLGIVLMATGLLLLCTPPARGEPVPGVVTYEVVSNAGTPVNVEYQDVHGRTFLADVTLPWRIDAPVQDVYGPPPDGSQVRADWRWQAWPGNWVTVRIWHQGELICQSTMDVGSSTCYGITPRIT